MALCELCGGYQITQLGSKTGFHTQLNRADTKEKMGVSVLQQKAGFEPMK